MKGLVISTEGDVREVEIAEGGVHAGLQSMYDAINVDLIDCVRLAPDLDMWVDDEGLLNGSLVNIWATALRQLFFEDVAFPYPLAGNALIMGGADKEGMTLGISEQRIAFCRKVVEDLKRTTR